MGLLNSLDKLLGVKRPAKAKTHKLKWKIPEVRYTAPIEDPDKTVYAVEKVLKARFTGGGEYFESVHAKTFGQGVFAYILVRTDKKTERETVAAEAYMIQEEDVLGFDVTSGPTLDQDLETLGYHYAFNRDYEVWSFKSLNIPITVFDIEGFGSFIEIALPATDIDSQRDRDEKRVMDMFKKLGISEKDILPADVVTLQMLSNQEQYEKGGGKAKGNLF